MQSTLAHPSRRALLGAMGAALLVPRAAHAAGLTEISGAAFGTGWRILLPEGEDPTPIGREVEAVFAEIDRIFSPWRADSAISAFNATTAGAPLPGREFAHVVRAALEVARSSDGAFDPTVGPLVARWGFGPIRGGARPDWRGIETTAGGTVKTRDDLTLDLCGIAKGWALDRAAARLAARGAGAFLLEVGGEFLAHGAHPDGRDWRVAVEVPEGAAVPVLRLPAGACVATSGTWAQSYRRDGRTYSHIIDGADARPVTGALRSVTVLAPDAMRADAWATALCAAGDSAGPDLAAARGIPALFLLETGGRLRQRVSPAMREHLA